MSASAPQFLAPLEPCNVPVRRCTRPREQASRRILVLRLGAHGDILMATPFLAALRANYPDAFLTWIVSHKEREVMDANPFVDEILLWDGRYWKTPLRRGLLPLWLARALAMRRQLRQRRFDVFVSFQPEEWPLLVQHAGAPFSVGVFDTFRQFNGNAPTSARTRLYSAAFTHSDLPPHRTEQYLLPLRALGLPPPDDKRMTIGYTREDAGTVDAFLWGARLPAGRRFVVLAPMTTWPSRCWPAADYARVGDALVRRHGCGVVWVGSEAEREGVVEAAARMQAPSTVAAGRFGFRELAALLDRAALVVSGDTGPMHLAAAVGRPYLALFGPTPVDGRAPLAGRGRSLAHPVPCGPCDRKVCPNEGANHLLCLRSIGVEEVVAAAEGLLEAGVQQV